MMERIASKTCKSCQTLILTALYPTETAAPIVPDLMAMGLQ